MNNGEVTTADLMKTLHGELDLLTRKKITPNRANAAARLAMSMAEFANLEVTHHKMRPARGNAVRPVVLVRGQKEEPVEEQKRAKKR